MFSTFKRILIKIVLKVGVPEERFKIKSLLYLLNLVYTIAVSLKVMTVNVQRHPQWMTANIVIRSSRLSLKFESLSIVPLIFVDLFITMVLTRSMPFKCFVFKCDAWSFPVVC